MSNENSKWKIYFSFGGRLEKTVKKLLKKVVKESNVSGNFVVVVLPEQVIEATVKGVYIYEYDKIEAIQLYVLKLLKMGIQDELMLGKFLGGINEEVVKEIMSSLIKNKLVECKNLSKEEVLKCWEELVNKNFVPQELVEELKNKLVDSIQYYFITSEGEYSAKSEKIRHKIPVDELRLYLNLKLEHLIDWDYSLISIARYSEQPLGKVTINLDIKKLLTEEEMRKKWNIPEEIADIAPEEFKVLRMRRANAEYFTIVETESKEVKKIYASTSEKKRGRKRKFYEIPLVSRIRDHIKRKLEKFINTVSMRNEKISNEVCILETPLGIMKFSNEDIEQLFPNEKCYYRIAESCHDGKTLVQISLSTNGEMFSLVTEARIIPKKKEVAKKALLAYVEHWIKENVREYVKRDDLDRLEKNLKKLVSLWSKYIGEEIRVSKTDMIEYFWRKKMYTIVYKLRLVDDFNLEEFN